MWCCTLAGLNVNRKYKKKVLDWRNGGTNYYRFSWSVFFSEWRPHYWSRNSNPQPSILWWSRWVKSLGTRLWWDADFHSAFFVARATFLLFKLNSFPLHSTRKFRREKKNVARATFLLFKLNSFPLHSTRKLRRQKKKVATHAVDKYNSEFSLINAFCIFDICVSTRSRRSFARRCFNIFSSSCLTSFTVSKCVSAGAGRLPGFSRAEISSLNF